MQAQTVTLTFTGRYATTNAYVQLSRIEITDLTQGWTEALTFPDAVAILTVGTGIDESVANGGFALSQNNPNPFTGTTDVNLTVADAGAVTLEIVDGNGKIVGTHRVRPEIGTHQFRISLSAAGTYVMTARQNGKTSSIKMVCNGAGDGNGIEYIGMVQTITYVLKSTTNNPFTFGDQMEYVGYATINGTEYESARISQAQNASETFALEFEVIQDGQPCPGTTTLKLDVRIDADTVWLTQTQMSLLFNVDRTVIVKHIANIYKTCELAEISTCVKIARVQTEGNRLVTREHRYYNLDMIISVGYRVNSINATKFRQWATYTLRNYLLHGYAVN